MSIHNESKISMGSYIDDEMESRNADGVDFISFTIDMMTNPDVIASYTREEFKKEKCIPKTPRLYWRYDENGNKVYIK